MSTELSMWICEPERSSGRAVVTMIIIMMCQSDPRHQQLNSEIVKLQQITDHDIPRIQRISVSSTTQYVYVIYTHKCSRLKNIQYTCTCTHGINAVCVCYLYTQVWHIKEHTTHSHMHTWQRSCVLSWRMYAGYRHWPPSSVVCWQSNLLGQEITQPVWWPLFWHCRANAVEQSAWTA